MGVGICVTIYACTCVYVYIYVYMYTCRMTRVAVYISYYQGRIEWAGLWMCLRGRVGEEVVSCQC